jgi:hypothetical protein
MNTVRQSHLKQAMKNTVAAFATALTVLAAGPIPESGTAIASDGIICPASDQGGIVKSFLSTSYGKRKEASKKVLEQLECLGRKKKLIWDSDLCLAVSSLAGDAAGPLALRAAHLVRDAGKCDPEWPPQLARYHAEELYLQVASDHQRTAVASEAIAAWQESARKGSAWLWWRPTLLPFPLRKDGALALMGMKLRVYNAPKAEAKKAIADLAGLIGGTKAGRVAAHLLYEYCSYAAKHPKEGGLSLVGEDIRKKAESVLSAREKDWYSQALTFCDAHNARMPYCED